MTDCGYLPEVSYTYPNNTYSNILLTLDQNVTFVNNKLGFFKFFFLTIQLLLLYNIEKNMERFRKMTLYIICYNNFYIHNL